MEQLVNVQRLLRKCRKQISGMAQQSQPEKVLEMRWTDHAGRMTNDTHAGDI